MGRAPCCEKNGLKKGPWTPEEDQKLIDYIHKHGYGNWRTLPKNAELQRCGKSCRLRWTNYLRPDIKRGRFSFEEEETVIQLHSILGNKWSAIAARLPGRTDNEIKNYWNTHIRKRLLRMGIDPVTHSPRLDLLDLSAIICSSSLYNTTLCPSSQINMFGLQQQQRQPLVMNSELLKIATSLLSTQGDQNPSISLIQDHVQVNGYTYNNSAQMQSSFNNPIMQTSQIQTPIQNPIPDCTTMTTATASAGAGTADTSNIATTSRSNSYGSFFGQDQVILGANFEQYPPNIPRFDDQIYGQWQNQDLFNVDNSTSLSYHGVDQTFINPSTSNGSDFHPNNMNEQQCLMTFAASDYMSSTPSSSPTSLNWTSNSSSTYISSSETESERDNFYCNDMIKLENPDLLEVNQFMLAQNC